ncbi:hypothetical protein Taro_038804 [Colocasia esculenta]|uniref:O-fucosyltransferase family protein n=1 Tax=Colocasia esculenta TaxID=4460 RepID=A0A843W4I1_COLES|nr:hypothetical protein [Colocasia esculenta]
MFVDPRQVVAGFLTVYMFTMLGNMVKQEQFSSPQAKLPGAPNAHFDVVRVEEEDVDTGPPVNEGPWKAQGKGLTPCWSKPDPKKPETSRGHITFSLAYGPEHHVSQVAAAVVIARYLGAALVLPDIRGSELGQKRKFEDIYNVDKFIESLDGVVKIVKELPSEVKTQKPAVVKVTGRVTVDYIRKNIEPIFKRNSNFRLAIFSSLDNPKMNLNPKVELDSVSCLATFGTLQLNPEIQNVVHLMVERLRALSQRADGHFIAVDLRADALDQKECREDGGSGRKRCYNAQEIGELLRRIGFGADTTIYVTQTWWDERLNALKGMFPKTYVKDDIIPSDEKGKFLRSGGAELVQALDFFICSQSDVFVPAISGLFYENVAGRRIASSRTQIFVPHQVLGASSLSDFNSTYVSKRSHMAYSCYC